MNFNKSMTTLIVHIIFFKNNIHKNPCFYSKNVINIQNQNNNQKKKNNNLKNFKKNIIKKLKKILIFNKNQKLRVNKIKFMLKRWMKEILK